MNDRPIRARENVMNTSRFVVVLTLVNFALLAFSLARPGTAAEAVTPVVRTHALQVLDDQGRVRASISVFPADPAVKMPDGTTGYPETVLLRLITSKGGPNVKLAAMENGAGLVLGGETNPTHVQVLAQGGSTSLKLTNKDGQSQLIKP
jgi:hypothetical protein